jgi:F-type H+-transporting ATPase subunit a
MFLAADIDPLGHVLDRNLIGGEHSLLAELAHANGWHLPAWLEHAPPLVTMHMVTLVVAALIILWIMLAAARAIDTGPASLGNDRYLTRGRLGQLVEVITLYLRDKVVQPVLGESTSRYLPYLLTLFFFVLMNNLLGLVPLLDLQHIAGVSFGDPHFAVIGGTATGNLAVTGGLAIVAFLVIQIHGLRELGVVGWAKHLLGGAPAYLAPIMVPVELMSMLIKPAALAIRLFANMLAGHTLMATLALFGLMSVQGLQSWIAGFGVSLVAGAFAVAISFLELFVAFLQAFIFMFLTAVFIGQLSHHGDHGEHEDEHEAAAAHA